MSDERTVAIVTSTDGGSGKEHTMLLAEYNARVVVYDPGGSQDGTGHDGAASIHTLAW